MQYRNVQYDRLFISNQLSNNFSKHASIDIQPSAILMNIIGPSDKFNDNVETLNKFPTQKQ